MLIPAACLASEAIVSSVNETYGPEAEVWVAQLNDSGVPSGMPAPHSFEASPACWQVVCPLGTTCQPCALSSATALDGLYGYAGLVALAGTNRLVGTAGT